MNRVRTSGGPSHELLVLLDRHRVMTTGQLARATLSPERTARYWIERLHRAGLVECVRPGRERGSAPRHWWLRPSGARLVSGTAAADGRPSGMFVAHAAAISEVYLALVERGSAVGVEVASWLTDRAGWQEWSSRGPWSYRLTPDAVATIRLGGQTAVAFMEVDLASMTQTVLAQKVRRYAAYAADRAWEARFECCPPMLLLTTTPTRAATFARVAGKVLGPAVGGDDPAASLVVAACGLVREPERAVVEPCWQLAQTEAAEVTLAELLGERLRARDASEAWQREQETVVWRQLAVSDLERFSSFSGLAEALGSPRAAEALRHLMGDDPETFLDVEPDLAEQVVDWIDERRRIGRFRARDLARPFKADLEERYAALWREQALRVLAAEAHIAADHPALYGLAATLASGRLLGLADLAYLDDPPTETRQQIQAALLGDHETRRSAAVDLVWHRMARRERHRASREDIAAEFDEQHLATCDTCALVYPNDETVSDRCRYCDGALADGTGSGPNPLNQLRERLGAKPTSARVSSS